MTSYTNIDYNDSCGDVSDKRIGRPADEGQGVSVAENISAKLYPNPNNGTFVLAYNIDKENDVELLVTDISGKLIYKASLDVLANLKQINATDFENGIYFVRLTNGAGKLLWTEKVVISK